MRNDKYDQKTDRRKGTLRSPLNLDEKVLVLAERLKTKDAPGNYIKHQLKICHFLIEIEFLLYIKDLNNGIFLYWVEEDGKKINGRSLR